jgi:hypothetical protein
MRGKRFGNLQVVFVGHGSATRVPRCVAPEALHPAGEVVLVASGSVDDSHSHAQGLAESRVFTSKMHTGRVPTYLLIH